jgi:ribosome recycling factor
MDYKEIVNKIKPELEKVVRFFEGELSKIRTGRATPSLVEDILVDVFGQKMPIKQLGAISSPEPRQLIIQPWDKSYVEPIERAISQSDIGTSPVVDKDVIRINLPALTEEYRKNLSRVLSDKEEEARKTIRKWREEAWGEVQEKNREGEIREDDKFKAKEELQKTVDEFIGKVESLGEKKRREIAD